MLWLVRILAQLFKALLVQLKEEIRQSSHLQNHWLLEANSIQANLDLHNQKRSGTLRSTAPNLRKMMMLSLLQLLKLLLLMLRSLRALLLELHFVASYIVIFHNYNDKLSLIIKPWIQHIDDWFFQSSPYASSHRNFRSFSIFLLKKMGEKLFKFIQKNVFWRKGNHFHQCRYCRADVNRHIFLNNVVFLEIFKYHLPLKIQTKFYKIPRLLSSQNALRWDCQSHDIEHPAHGIRAVNSHCEFALLRKKAKARRIRISAA